MIGQKVTIATACMMVEHDKRKNAQKIISFIEKAAEEGAHLLVLPECALQGFLWTWDWEKFNFREDEDQRRYFSETAEPIPGPFTDTVSRYAARHKMLIQVGMVERVDRGRETFLYNSTPLIGPEGLKGVFRKIHISVENMIFQGGEEFSVFDTFVGKIGPIICADLEYPESVRVLALKGAEIITMSTAWGMNPRTDYSGYKYDLLGRANAVMNGVWMVMADQVGSTERSNERCFGHSRIIDPKGKIIAGIGYEEGLVTAKVDIKEGIESALRRFYLGHRHPECYKIITSEV